MRNKKEQARFPHWLKQALMLLQEFIYYKPDLRLTVDRAQRAWPNWLSHSVQMVYETAMGRAILINKKARTFWCRAKLLKIWSGR
jgi:hypothetical protein